MRYVGRFETCCSATAWSAGGGAGTYSRPRRYDGISWCCFRARRSVGCPVPRARARPGAGSVASADRACSGTRPRATRSASRPGRWRSRPACACSVTSTSRTQATITSSPRTACPGTSDFPAHLLLATRNRMRSSPDGLRCQRRRRLGRRQSQALLGTSIGLVATASTRSPRGRRRHVNLKRGCVGPGGVLGGGVPRPRSPREPVLPSCAAS